MKEVIMSNWNWMRVIRLLAGVAIIIQAIANKDAVFGVAGVLFTIMALFNTGCCGVGGCNTPIPKSNKRTDEITYEEVVKQ